MSIPYVMKPVGSVMDEVVHFQCGGGPLEVTGTCTIYAWETEELACQRCGQQYLDVTSYTSVVPANTADLQPGRIVFLSTTWPGLNRKEAEILERIDRPGIYYRVKVGDRTYILPSHDMVLSEEELPFLVDGGSPSGLAPCE